MMVRNGSEKGWLRTYTLLAGITLLLLLVTAAAGLFGAQTYRDFVSPKYIQESRAQDLITLVSGVPLLVLAVWAVHRKKAWGIPLWAGVLCYELYVYAIYTIGGVYNPFFPAYTAVSSLSLYSIIGILGRIDADWFQQQTGGRRLPRRWLAGFFLAICVIFGMIWIGEVLNSIAIKKAADGHLIFVFDLMIVLPAFAISAVKLLRRQASGNLLAGMMLIKFDSLCISITLGQLFRARHDIPVESALLSVFIPLGLLGLLFTGLYFKQFILGVKSDEQTS